MRTHSVSREQAEAFFTHLLSHGWCPFDKRELFIMAEDDRFPSIADYLAGRCMDMLERRFSESHGTVDIWEIRPWDRGVISINGVAVPMVSYFWSEHHPGSLRPRKVS